MKLNKKNRDELRAKIVEQLKEVPEGQKIKLDKELLEELLFEVVTLNKEKGIIVKLPIWSGDFLRKIDLSQVDFTNVSWSILSFTEADDYNIYYEGIDANVEAEQKIEKIIKDKVNEGFILSNGYVVSYNGTNANIDLTKSFEAIYGNIITLRGCGFTGLDFSHQDLSNIDELELRHSSIADTALTIPESLYLNGYRSSFSGLDLSSWTLDDECCFKDFPKCNLRNTGLKLIFKSESIKKLIDDHHIDDGDIEEAMNNYLVGCYINGKKVLSSAEKEAQALQIKTEYEKMKDEIFTSVLGSIEEQKNNMKK